MIWVTGDIHGDPSRLSSRSFDEQEFFEKQDENWLLSVNSVTENPI